MLSLIFRSNFNLGSELTIHTAHRRWFTRDLVIVSAITLLATSLRLYRADDSLWLDELHTSWVVVDGLEHIVPRAAMGNQSPVYFYATWLSTSLFGMNEIAVRLPSLVAGILLVPAVFLAVRGWTSSTIAASLAAILTSIDRDFLFYAQEARPYGVVQLVGLVQVFVFSHLITASDPTDCRFWTRPLVLRLCWIAASVLLFYLHYTAALLLVGELVCYVMLAAVRRLPKSYGPQKCAFDFIVVTLFNLGASVHLLEIAERRGNWSGIAEYWPSGFLLRFFDVYLVVPCVLVIAIVLIRAKWNLRPLIDGCDWRVVLLTICWMLVPVGSAWLCMVSNFAPLTLMRFVIVSAAAPIVFASFCCAIMPSATFRGIVAGVVILAAVLTSDVPAQYWADGRIVGQRNEDWRGAVARINESSTMPVVVEPGLIEVSRPATVPIQLWREYREFPIRGIYRVDQSQRRSHGEPYWMLVRRSEFETRYSFEIETMIRPFEFQSFGSRLTLVRVGVENEPSR